MNNQVFVVNLALYLLDQTNSVTARWEGKLSAAEQRKIFGRYLGRGTIVIDGDRELVFNRVKVCFGLDTDDRNVTNWRDL